MSLITVDGSSLYQPFTEILSGVNTTTVTLNSVNIAHGMTAGSGGGILNHGALTLINSTITGNSPRR